MNKTKAKPKIKNKDKAKAKAELEQFGCVVATPIGKLGIKTDNQSLIQIVFLANSARTFPAKTKYAKKVVSELKKYFQNPKHFFQLSIKPTGTPLQQKIWRALSKIPVGTVLSYGELAKKLKTSPRVVGNACRKNPTPIVVPCHRIVAANSLGGYAGQTIGSSMQNKIWLLLHEGFGK